jgi:uncharacterized membrane protein (DUF2068 family)
LLFIGTYKILEALLFIGLGVGALRLLHKDVGDVLTRLALNLRLDPDSGYLARLLEHSGWIDDRRLRQISFGGFFYAALHALEGIGLVLEKMWAEFLVILITGSFLPLELYSIARHPTWIRVLLALINLAILVYLIALVRRQQARHRESAPESEEKT